MAKRILVPLDDAESSEEIILVVAALASGAGSSVRLLRVEPVPHQVMGPAGRTIAYVDQEMDRLTAEGLRDLSRHEARFVGVPVESTVRFGDPVEDAKPVAFHLISEAQAGGTALWGPDRERLYLLDYDGGTLAVQVHAPGRQADNVTGATPIADFIDEITPFVESLRFDGVG